MMPMMAHKSGHCSIKCLVRPVVSFTGDGAYDRDDACSAVIERHPDAAVIVAPRSSAVASETAAAVTAVDVLIRMLEPGRPKSVRIM
jgi:hypothetical protein